MTEKEFRQIVESVREMYMSTGRDACELILESLDSGVPPEEIMAPKEKDGKA